MQETRVRFLSQVDPLEQEMVTHSSILAWETPWTEEPGRPQTKGRREWDTTEQLSTQCMDLNVLNISVPHNFCCKVQHTQIDISYVKATRKVF